MHNIKVMIIDDEPGMRLGVQRVLKNHRFDFDEEIRDLAFDVYMAETGEAGLEMIPNVQPDLLILDHKLPGIQGIEILDELNSQKADILTVMVTAYASIEVAISATKGGAFDFLAKPFTPAELKHTIDKAVRHLILKRKAQQLAEEKRQVRFQFISVLAHELKSPIAAVEGYLRIMDQQMAGEKISDYEKMIKRSRIRLEGMRKMIMDLLDLTRIESGKTNRSIEAICVNEILQDAIDSVTPDADDKGIQITASIDESLVLNGDRSELEIIFNNFMSNGIKYNKAGGSLNVEVDAIDQGIQVRFIDTGIGMKAEDVDRLFGEFVRIKSDETKHITGSGLGLSIVKKLIQLYDGSVDVNSEPGAGSTFSIVLKDVDPNKGE